MVNFKNISLNENLKKKINSSFMSQVQTQANIWMPAGSSDIIVNLPTPLTYTGASQLSVQNIFLNGPTNSSFNIPVELQWSTTINGLLTPTVTLPAGSYNQAQLIAVLTTASLGIIYNVPTGYFNNSTPANSLVIIFDSEFWPYLSILYGLTAPYSESNGGIAYQIPLSSGGVSGQFPALPYFGLLSNWQLRYGFSSNPISDTSILSSIPLTYQSSQCIVPQAAPQGIHSLNSGLTFPIITVSNTQQIAAIRVQLSDASDPTGNLKPYLLNILPITFVFLATY